MKKSVPLKKVSPYQFQSLLLSHPIQVQVHFVYYMYIRAVARISIRGNTWGGGPCGGSGEPSGPHKAMENYSRRIFENVQVFIKKSAKTHYFSLFYKDFKNPALNFRAFGWQIVRKFLRKCWKFLMKIQ